MVSHVINRCPMILFILIAMEAIVGELNLVLVKVVDAVRIKIAHHHFSALMENAGA